MSNSFPDNLSIEYYKKRAKKLLKNFKNNKIESCRQLRLIKRYSSLSDAELLKSPIKLTGTQFSVALEFGYESWQQLVNQYKQNIKKEVIKMANLMKKTKIPVEIQLGTTDISMKELSGVGVGSIIELDNKVSSSVKLLSYGQAIAQGEVVLVDDYLGMCITKLLCRKSK